MKPGSRTGIVLAGGRSSRMGQPKMPLPLGAISMLARTLEALRPSCDEILVLAAPSGHHDGVDQALGNLKSIQQLRVLRDDQPYRGPLPALASAMDQAAGELCFVAAGDTPLLAPALVRGMFASLEPSTEIHALVPNIHGSLQPLTAVYRTRPMAASFRKALERGENSPRRVLQGVSFAQVPQTNLELWDPEALSFLNVNDAEDLRRVRKILAQATAASVKD